MRKLALCLVLLLGCRKIQAPSQEPCALTKPPFAGCFGQRSDPDSDSTFYWQCEDADGLWKCNEKMERASCVWAGPLPNDHPLRRAEVAAGLGQRPHVSGSAAVVEAP